jgi:hypothetical protein
MNLFERRFRRKFTPQGDGYLFRQWNRDVQFSADEVEALVAQWRRYWASPAIWAGWLFFGVAVPLLLTHAMPGLAAVMAVVVNIAIVVLLVHGEMIPNGAAEMRVVVGPGRGRRQPSIYDNLFGIGFALFWLFAMPDVGHADAFKWFWWAIVAGHTLLLGKRLLAQYRRRRAA